MLQLQDLKASVNDKSILNGLNFSYNSILRKNGIANFYK